MLEILYAGDDSNSSRAEFLIQRALERKQTERFVKVMLSAPFVGEPALNMYPVRIHNLN